MLLFYYDLVDKFVDRSNYEYCQMDTDSAYIALDSLKITHTEESQLLKKLSLKINQAGMSANPSVQTSHRNKSTALLQFGKAKDMYHILSKHPDEIGTKGVDDPTVEEIMTKSVSYASIYSIQLPFERKRKWNFK